MKLSMLTTDQVNQAIESLLNQIPSTLSSSLLIGLQLELAHRKLENCDISFNADGQVEIVSSVNDDLLMEKLRHFNLEKLRDMHQIMCQENCQIPWQLSYVLQEREQEHSIDRLLELMEDANNST